MTLSLATPEEEQSDQGEKKWDSNSDSDSKAYFRGLSQSARAVVSLLC